MAIKQAYPLLETFSEFQQQDNAWDKDPQIINVGYIGFYADLGCLVVGLSYFLLTRFSFISSFYGQISISVPLG